MSTKLVDYANKRIKETDDYLSDDNIVDAYIAWEETCYKVATTAGFKRISDDYAQARKLINEKTAEIAKEHSGFGTIGMI